MARTDDEIRALAQREYTELCNRVENLPYDEIDNFVNENNLSYGALSPVDREDMVDINYKHLGATVYKRENGLCGVNLYVEIYNDDGEMIDPCELGDNPNLNLCIVCGERHDEDHGHWITSHEFICDKCHSNLPQWVLDELEKVEHECIPDKVVDYLNKEFGSGLVYFDAVNNL